MAPAVMLMLSKEKKKINAMIINVILPDSHCFELLAQAVVLNIIVLTYICSKKPLVEQTVTFLWQFVWSEKLQREKSIKRVETKGDHINVDDNNYLVGDEERDQEKNMPINIEEQSNNNNVVSNGKHKLRRKRGRKSTKEINEGSKTIMRKEGVVIIVFIYISA
ncbi:hypothetical protein KY289_019609 [Solanum tuberosum]|nr:hypothetical protein KY289_019609 [Solanum tuberosum]